MEFLLYVLGPQLKIALPWLKIASLQSMGFLLYVLGPWPKIASPQPKIALPHTYIITIFIAIYMYIR